MNSQVKLKELKLTTEELNNLIVDSIQDIKGKNIVKLDLRQLEEAPCDYFIICEGDSNTQVKAIANNIHKRIKEVTPPSWKELQEAAVLVFIASLIIAGIIFAMDWVFGVNSNDSVWKGVIGFLYEYLL